MDFICSFHPEMMLKNFLFTLLVLPFTAVLYLASAAASAAEPAEEIQVADDLWALSQSFAGEPLPAETQSAPSPASPFAVTLLQQEQQLQVSIKMADGSYIYRDSLKAEVNGLQLQPQMLPAGTKIEDIQGTHEVFFTELSLTYDLRSDFAGAEFKFSSQGCSADGICFPPATHTIRLQDFVPYSSSDTKPAAAVLLPAEQAAGSTADTQTTAAPDPGVTPLQAAAAPDVQNWSAGSEDQQVLSLLGDNFILGLGLCLVLGLLLDLTPCVLPMLPVISAMAAGSAHCSRAQVVRQNAGYALGLCLVYTLLGLLFASAGAYLQGILQHPLFIGAVSLVLLLLALVCADVLKLPQARRFNNYLQNFAARQERGRFGSALILGGVSALIASPCTSAPLAGALLYVMQTGSMAKGAAAFFCIGLGMAAPLFVVGLCGSSLLRRCGRFSLQIRKLLAVLLVIAAVYLLRSLLPPQLTAVLLAAVAALGLLFVGAAPAIQHLRQKSYLPALLLAAVSLGLFQTIFSALAPREAPAGAQTFIVVDSLEELAGFNADKVLLDFTAAWCTNCKTMEARVFSDPEFTQMARQLNLTLVQFDITDVDDPRVQEAIERFKLFGVPYVMVLDRGEVKAAAAGYQDLEQIRKLAADALALNWN